MELHLAIKNILKYQGEEFLLDPKMINALTDFQAYEQHPALKNIFRILHQDGYIKKILSVGKWDVSCDQIVFDIERDYSFSLNLVEYTLKSVADGLGYNCQIPSISEQKDNSSKPQPKISAGKTWSKMSEIEKVNFLESKIEFKNDTFIQNNLTLKNFSVSNVYKNGKEYSFEFGYELINTGKTKDLLELCFAIYDEHGKLRATDSEYIFQEIQGFFTDSTTLYLTFPFRDIDKIIIYMKGH